jgi:predicted O-methyltransferase YrrM
LDRIWGASATVLAAAAKTRGGHVFCVDTWRNDAMSEGGRDTYGEFLQNTKPYSNWITPLRGQSSEIAASFTQPTDLLFIDGDHSYDGVMADLHCWLPKLRDGGWLVMHDWGWAEGVKRAVQEVVVERQLGKPLVLPNLYAAQMRDMTKHMPRMASS